MGPLIMPSGRAKRAGLRAAALALAALLSVGLVSAEAKAGAGIRPASFDELFGWRSDDHAQALRTFLRSCSGRPGWTREGAAAAYLGRREDWARVCDAAASLGGKVSRERARRFFETHFEPVEMIARGGHDALFTGYFEPEVKGARTPSRRFSVPLLRRPGDLLRLSPAEAIRGSAGPLRYARMVAGRPQPYFTRAQIEQGALAGRGLELVYLRDRIDAFFLHVQGSGRIRLADGSIMRVGFAGKNGHPYTSIGRTLIEWGELDGQGVSMQSIRRWLKRHSGRADELMWQNRSFIFFRELEGHDAGLGPVGAQGLPLTPGRSMAIDPAYYFYGAPLWLETLAPSGKEGRLKAWNRLLVAQDTGSAIKGPLRGDVFWGSGARAGAIAGRMKSSGRLFLLRPRLPGARASARD